jgi:hypothetical protein
VVFLLGFSEVFPSAVALAFYVTLKVTVVNLDCQLNKLWQVFWSVRTRDFILYRVL